jgi:hypothetical protein
MQRQGHLLHTRHARRAVSGCRRRRVRRCWRTRRRRRHLANQLRCKRTP